MKDNSYILVQWITVLNPELRRLSSSQGSNLSASIRDHNFEPSRWLPVYSYPGYSGALMLQLRKQDINTSFPHHAFTDAT